MANSIIGVIHLASADGVAFAEKVRKCISEMQDKGLCVEVQYQTTAIKDEVAEIVYSALLIGRAQNGETAEKCKHCCLFDDYEVYHPPYPEN